MRHDHYATEFWAQVTKTEGCWIFVGKKSLTTMIFAAPWRKIGYGSLRISARRVAYELTYGDQGQGKLLLDATCNNPCCVRPDHLTLRFKPVHLARRLKPVQNRQKAPDNKPKRRPATTLNVEDVRQIRQFVAEGCSTRGVAEAFGVTRQTINDIRRRKTWRDVP